MYHTSIHDFSSYRKRGKAFEMGCTKYRVLSQLSRYLEENGYSPTVRELAEIVELSSHSSVQLHLDGLQSDGYLSRRERSPRSLSLTPKGRQFLASIPRAA